MLANETTSLDEVAAAIGRPPAWLKRNWLKIHRRFGFPRKSSLGWVWPRALVEAWLAGPQEGSPPWWSEAANDPGRPPAAPADPVEAAREAARKRYGGRA